MNSLDKISTIKQELKDTQLIIVTKKQTIGKEFLRSNGVPNLTN